MMSYFRQRGRSLETWIYLLRWGKGARGEEVSSEWGGGGGRTYRKRYLISDRIRCCQATNDEKPDF